MADHDVITEDEGFLSALGVNDAAIKNLFYICGFNVEEEKQVAGGRIDLAIETPEIIYIMELKMADNGGAQAAVEQIASRHYADAYAASKKKLINLALVFDKGNRGLIDWQEADK